MIGASKILTVSYGTFSCTLEGFDEPFNTMKAIAEYFRDLAAEDRYFGAEPPTPDAAMLHKIAEREIHRRVEAKIQENGVILRTGEALDAPVAVAPAAPAPMLAPLIDHEDQPLLSDASASVDSVAAKLSRLRASAAAMALPAVVPEIFSEDQHADEAVDMAAVEGAAVAMAATDEPIAELAQTPPVTITAAPLQIDVADHDIADAAIYAEDAADDDWSDAGAATDSVFAAQFEEASDDLPASDAQVEEDILPTTFSDHDETPNDLTELQDQDAIDDLARLDGIATGFDASAMVDDFTDHPADIDDQNVAALPAQDAGAFETAADNQVADDALLASLGAMIEKSDQTDRAALVDDFEDEFDGFEDDFSIDAAQTAPVPAASDIDDDRDTLASATSLADDGFDGVIAPVDVPRARARVIKIRRADAQSFAAQPAADPESSLLSAEAEAALQAELAALEAEVMPAQPDAPTLPMAALDAGIEATSDALDIEDAAPLAATPVRPQRPVRSISVIRPAADFAAIDAFAPAVSPSETGNETVSKEMVTVTLAANLDTADLRHDIEGDLADDAVGRLMAQTNSALDGVDVKRRQSAIAHLKAAVASTEADRQIAPNQPKDDLIESYRSDLESVVRPTAPDARTVRAANGDRPQPLVLVSAQRIDRLPRSENAARPEAAPRIVSPVRPRRIATGTMAAMQQDSLLGSASDELDEDEGLDDAAINMFAETESFSDFADRLGASDLPDLLEAAAVYCASVLGRPEFSRPLVLRQIATLPATADLSREDGLRVFGTLLRQGRITKTRRGQFAVTDRSPILAEAIRSAS